MKQRFAVFAEGAKPRIYKFPVNQTARLINEFPFRKVEVFETLDGARVAAVAIVKRAKTNAKPNLAMFSPRPNPEDEVLKTLSEITEDRVERYPF